MGERGLIARPTRDGGFEGIYHHDMSWPLGLGKTLWDAFHGHFASAGTPTQRAAAMTKFFIEDHPAGWSLVVRKDLSIAPGWVDYGDAGYEKTPRCYCHGKRHEEPMDLYRCLGGDRCDGSQCDPRDIEWAYVIDGITLDVYASQQGRHVLVASVKWDGPEPDWTAMEQPA